MKRTKLLYLQIGHLSWYGVDKGGLIARTMGLLDLYHCPTEKKINIFGENNTKKCNTCSIRRVCTIQQ